MYFLCVSSCRSGVPSFFRRAREKIEVLKVIKIGKNWEKLGKTGKNWEKLGKTGQNWAKLGKTGQNWGKLRKFSFYEFSRVFMSFGEFW